MVCSPPGPLSVGFLKRALEWVAVGRQQISQDSASLHLCFVNNGRVTAEITLSTAHVPQEAPAQPRVLCAVHLDELHATALAAAASGATLSDVVVIT